MSNFFGEPKTKTINAFNKNGERISRPSQNFKLRVGVYGLLKEHGKLLMQHNPVLKGFALPGGAVDIGETLDAALIREFKEETGLEIKPIKVLDVIEDFYTYEEFDAHSIFILYEVKRIGGQLLTQTNEEQDSDQALFMSPQELTPDKVLRVFRKFSKHIE
jgi:ADP-ribose pyrophosphatase YjhB (NUDIX family)